MPLEFPRKPVPVLLLSHALGHGGGERQTALTALSMDRARFEPHVAFCEGGFWLKRLQEAGVPLHAIGPRSLIGPSALREARRLRDFIVQHRIRIVQTFDYSMNFLGIPVARTVPGVIGIASLRCHINLIPARYRWLNAMSYGISAAVVVNSEALRRELCDAYSIPSRKVFTCYNGLDTAAFQPGPRMPRQALVIGTVCVLRPEKNLPLLLEAFAAATQGRDDVRLLIVGSGPEERALKALAGSLGLPGKCVFHPSTPDVAAILREIDIFVLTSLSEGLSNALMEAMACGCCVIASDVGGNPELVSDGVTGVLFPSEDRPALIRRLTGMISDAERRRALGDAAAVRVRNDFSLDAAVSRIQAVYDAVLSA